MAANREIDIEVAYANQTAQCSLKLKVPIGISILEAIQRSTILQTFPEITLAHMKMGIFGKMREPHEVVKDGERIEIYRPLRIDPKEARRKRAKDFRTSPFEKGR